MKFVKAAILIAVAIKLLSLFGRDVHEWATDFITRHGIDTANRFVESTLTKLEGVGNKQIVAFSTVAFCYSGLLMTEGIGLWMQKRWAEWLTAVATSLFIPIELYEIYERFTWVRSALLVFNVFIVWYLVTRLKDEKKEVLDTKDTKKNALTVKICGITNLDDALHAVSSGADELGFNFYRKSPRFIEPALAKSIIEKLDNGLFKVGVFVNESQERILEIAETAGLDAIQLHGDENHRFVHALRQQTNLYIIKAVRTASDLAIDNLLDYDVHAILIDGHSSKNVYGGSGVRADLATARDICDFMPCDIYLAGGLSPENVADAVNATRPYAVDVASGVESSPGKKDPAKVAAFIKAAKEAI